MRISPSRRTAPFAVLEATVMLAVAACGGSARGSSAPVMHAAPPLRVNAGPLEPRPVIPLSKADATAQTGIHKIEHVIIIVQENHSFDNYFGAYPGADGIPTYEGVPTVCLPDPAGQACIRPFHDPNDSSFDPPHQAVDAITDINGGPMNGFLLSAARAQAKTCHTKTCTQANLSAVVGYHDERDIPTYWGYAKDFVLQDHLFAPAASYSLPSHLALLSGWVARCPAQNPMSCTSEVANPEVAPPAEASVNVQHPYRWTDITYLLHKAAVSWNYYSGGSSSGDLCAIGTDTCTLATQQMRFEQYVNPVAGFQTVHDDGQLGNIRPVNTFYGAARDGTLAAVNWIVPPPALSEHPPYSLKAGQAFVSSLVNAVRDGPDWNSSAIFVTWDEWGGFYDHVTPPTVAGMSLGMRVPGLVISPYARHGYIDHQVLSFSSYLRFIEDDFLNGQRLDPMTDGRPDGRQTVSDSSAALGDLARDFDFSRAVPQLLAPRGQGSVAPQEQPSEAFPLPTAP